MIFTAPPFTGGTGSSGPGYDTYMLYNRNFTRSNNLAPGGFGGQATEIRVYPTSAASRPRPCRTPEPWLRTKEVPRCIESHPRVAGGPLAVRSAGCSPSTAVAVAAADGAPRRPRRSTVRDVGIVCTTGARHGPTFNLTTETGYINLPDGNTAFMWGYSSGFDAVPAPRPGAVRQRGRHGHGHPAQHAARDVSIVFPGQDDVLANGAPAQPQFSNRRPGTLTSLTNTAAANGGTVTYSFVADHPGTFLYESGTNPEKQVRMGLFGALIVRPDRPTRVRPDYAVRPVADSRFDRRDEEFMVLLSEIDPYLHQAVEQGLNDAST